MDTTHPGPVDDERLSAWLDGELADPAEKARVEQWLRDHPADAARLQRWADDRDALRAHYARQLDEPVPQRLKAALRRDPARRGWRQAAMAAGLLLAGGVLGALLSWQWQERRFAQQTDASAVAQRPGAGGSAGWVQRAMFAHGVYVPEPRHAVEVRAQEEHLSRWLTRRIDVPVKLFDLREFGFELVGGRLLPDGSGKSAQLMYQDAQGLRVTVYLRKPDVPTEATFRYEQQGEVGMFYWVESGAGYALVGALPREQLLAMAESIYRQHPPAAASAPR